MGIVLVIAGDFSGWNVGLPPGSYVPLIVATSVVGTAYIALMLCIGEIISGLPFGGGAYGLVRITVGFYPGFLVAMLEVVYLIVMNSLGGYSFASTWCALFNLSSTYTPLLCLAYLLLAWGILILGSMVFSFSRTNNCFALYSASLVILYCFWPTGPDHTTIHVQHTSTPRLNFINCFSQVSWLFMGIENLAYSCSIVSCPKEVVSKGSIACIFTLLLTGTLVVSFATGCYSQNPDLLGTEPFPLNSGYMSLLQCSYNQATALTIPISLASFYSFMFCYGTLISALSESGLLPSLVSRKFNGIPWFAYIVGNSICYCICLVVYFIPQSFSTLQNVCFLAAFIAYCAYFIGYACLKLQFSEIQFTFSSPVGIFGAVYGFSLFLSEIVCLIFLQNYGYRALYTLSGLCTCFTVYYFKVAKKREKLSPDERTSLLIAHVIKLKNRRAKWGKTFTATNRGSLIVQKIMSISSNPSSAKRPTKVHAILQDKKGAEELRTAAQKAFCVENVDFCNAVLSYKISAVTRRWRWTKHSNSRIETAKFLHAEFMKIIENFVADGSPSEINISSADKNEILQYRDLELFLSLDKSQQATILDRASAEIEKVLFQNLC